VGEKAAEPVTEPEPDSFVMPDDSMGLIGSPGEFARMARDGVKLPDTTTVQLGPKTELRTFTLPPGANQLKRGNVPGYRIQVVRPGDVLATRKAAEDA